MEQLPQDIDIVNLSLGGYTDDDAAPLAIACALQGMRKQRGVVVAAAGNDAQQPARSGPPRSSRCWRSARSTRRARSG